METFARVGSTRLGARVTCGFRKLLRANSRPLRVAHDVHIIHTRRRVGGIASPRDASRKMGGTQRRGRKQARKNRRAETARGRGKRRRKRRFVHVRIMHRARLLYKKCEVKIRERAKMFR